MKALSVRQPYANQILSGQKSIEVRSWPTRHRGELLIVSCAARRGNQYGGPYGVSLCVATLADCRPMTKRDETAAMSALPGEGAWAWVLTDVRPVEQIPVTGRLGIYELHAGEGKIL